MLAGLLDPMHLIILLVIVLLIAGPRRLPQLGRSVGETLKMFKDGIDSMAKTPKGPDDQDDGTF